MTTRIATSTHMLSITALCELSASAIHGFAIRPVVCCWSSLLESSWQSASQVHQIRR